MVLGAYEDKGEVVIEFSDSPAVRLSWRQAMERYVAILEVEEQLPFGQRELSSKVKEQLKGAIVEARKKDPDQSNWTPPLALRMCQAGTKSEIDAARRVSKLGLILPE